MRIILFGTVLLFCLVASETEARRGRGGSCRDIAQGNGSVVTGDGRHDRGQFHVKADQRGESFSGRLDFRDRATNLRIRSRQLVDYQQTDTETRQLTFALSDLPDDVAVVLLRDLGKGRNDFFEITAGDYFASGNLRNGNVRLKRQGNCDGTGEDDGGDDDGTPDQGPGDN